jgi:hypothetical protein
LDVKVGRYGIVGDNLIQCFQGIILTPGTTAFVANVASKAFVVKQDLSNKEDALISSSHFLSSTFIDLNNSFDEDVSLPMSFNMNVYGLFPAPISNVYIVEDMPSNLNMVHG